MLVLFTDFGAHDLYTGQVHAVLAQQAPGVPIVDLLHEAPAFNMAAGAHLLAAFSSGFSPGSVFLAIVDPGVGSGRAAMVVEADARFYVGPDNGLLSVVAGRSRDCRVWRIEWRPERLASSFHGRDLFAPVAARIARGAFPHDWVKPVDRLEVEFDPSDFLRVIYVDHYGNAMTGIRGQAVERNATLRVRGACLKFVRVFAEAPNGEAFWYENSIGLVEIAVNQGSAAQILGLAVGQQVEV